MKKRMSATVAAVLISTTVLLVLLYLLGRASPGVSNPALAAPMQITPTVALVDPSSAPNDLDMLIVITGSDFVSVSAVYLGDTSLSDVEWMTSTVLRATVPWGMDPGVYTLTVSNPGGESDDLPNAFTVTQGIGVWNTTGLYGGDVAEVVVNPLTPTTIYAVSHDVGMFRSTDGGATWEFKVAGGEYSVRNLAIDPVSPTVLYMLAPWDLHRSDDGGDTWTPLDAPGDIPFPHPTDTGTLFVSNRWEGESGLWKSTNYGQTWLTVTNGLTDTRVNNLVFDPTDPMTIYVGTELGNLFVSSDGGTSWSFVNQPTNFIQELAINPRGDHELWVSNSCFSTPKETLKSTNADHTAWTPVADPVGSNSAKTIAFPPEAWGGDIYSNTVFFNSCWGEAHRSDDGGNSWSLFGPGTGGWALTLHPSDPAIAYRSSGWDGVIKTTDGGANWQIANEGLTAEVPDQLEAIPSHPDMLYALTGREGGIYKGTGGGGVWQFLTIPGAGDTSYVLVDPVTPTRVYVGDSGPARVHISEDGGETWPITSVITVTEPYTDCSNFINVLAADASQTGTLLLGMEHFCMGVPGVHAGDLYYSTNAGLRWELATISGTDTISPVTDISHDALTRTIVYAATGVWDMGSGLLRSTDGGLKWEHIGAGTPGLDVATSIAVEPSPPYRVFVLGSDGVYVSQDHGASWHSTGFWRGDIEQLLCTHENPSALYYATGIGLLRSTNGGQTIYRAAGTLGHIPIYSLATVAATDRVILYAGTTGGYVESGAAQTLDLANNDGILVNAGVYRYTTRRTWELYLPLVFKAYTP